MAISTALKTDAMLRARWDSKVPFIEYPCQFLILDLEPFKKQMVRVRAFLYQVSDILNVGVVIR